jgi:epoxyqueuosine reductase
MTYLHRQAARRGDPGLVLAGAKSIVSVSQSYYTGQMPEHIRCDPARGQIASYAWGDDYHDVLLEKVEALAAVIRELSPNAELRCYVDTGPVAERDHGARAGTGFIGKNTLLIHPRAGSYFFLGEILTTADLAPTPGEGMPSCGSCTRCLNACPTHAFPAAYVLNSNLCISYLTIEYRGIIPRVLRAKMGNHIFGCDDCQTCCPWNERFSRETDELRYQSELGRRAPELAVLAGMNATDYRAYFFGSAVTRCTHVMMLRNVAVALGNWGECGGGGYVGEVGAARVRVGKSTCGVGFDPMCVAKCSALFT